MTDSVYFAVRHQSPTLLTALIVQATIAVKAHAEIIPGASALILCEVYACDGLSPAWWRSPKGWFEARAEGNCRLWKTLFSEGRSEALSEIHNCNAFLQVAAGEENLLRNWCAVYTFPCHEKQAAVHLAVRGIEHFLPLYRLTRRRNDGRTVALEMPLFPSYLFVYASHSDRARILGSPGVLSIVGTSRGAFHLPAAEIESLRNSLHLYRARPHPFLNVGERAKVRNGPLAGLQGIVVRRKDSSRLVLTLELIMRSIAVEIDLADVEPLRPALYRQ